MDEPDGEAEIEDILMSVEDTFKEYNLPYSKSLEKSLYNAAEREVPKKGTYRHNMRKTSHYSGREMPSEVFTQKMKEWLLPDVKYLPPKQIKQIERDNGRDYRRGYITNGEFTEENFEFVMEYLQTLSKVPLQENEFYSGLTGYLLADYSEEDACVLEYIARSMSEDNIFFFSEKILHKYFQEKQQLQLIQKFLESGILSQTGKWYHFWNKKYMYNLAFKSVLRMSEEQKSEYYKLQLDCIDENRELWIDAIKWRQNSLT